MDSSIGSACSPTRRSASDDSLGPITSYSYADLNAAVERPDNPLLKADIRPRSVCFNPQMRLILIPCIHEYKAAKLVDQLWWSSGDYFAFQNSAHSEIRQMAIFEGAALLPLPI